MKTTKQALLVAFVFAGIIMLSFAWAQKKNAQLQQTPQITSELNPVLNQRPMKIGDAEVMVEIRETDEEKELGLSYRTSLAEDQGMLFVYTEKVRPSFWMKGMQFDLDMIWIADGKVVEISENIPAPKSAKDKVAIETPTFPIDRVLEVNAGWVQKKGVTVGDIVSFPAN